MDERGATTEESRISTARGFGEMLIDDLSNR